METAGQALDDLATKVPFEAALWTADKTKWVQLAVRLWKRLPSADREGRLLQAEALMVRPPGRADEARTEKDYAAWGFGKGKTKGDGNCFYHAVNQCRNAHGQAAIGVEAMRETAAQALDRAAGAESDPLVADQLRGFADGARQGEWASVGLQKVAKSLVLWREI